MELSEDNEQTMLQRAISIGLESNEIGTSKRKRSHKEFEEEEQQRSNFNSANESPPIKKQKIESDFDDFFNQRKQIFAAKARKECKEYEQGWTCNMCTFINNDLNSSQCEICDTPRISNQDKEETRTITFITYNVWFDKLKVNERMNAIGRIIESENSDIVCLQEVTPLILGLLQSGDWFKTNKYLLCPLPLSVTQRGYFTVILTKHRFVNGMTKLIPFKNSIQGRFLMLAPIKLDGKNGPIIYAATSHLESQINHKMNFSKERTAQFQFSLAQLDKLCENNNVIFGGDMNWDRGTKTGQQIDGDMSRLLGDEWIDCFKHLHPNKNGFTYDGKQNQMLSNYLQKRKDRILYRKNGNLKLTHCQMIGKEPIPNVTYTKMVRRKMTTLSVLPSDHYGLLAKFDLV